MIKSWLNKPYPLIEDSKTKLMVVFGFVIFIVLFLYVYQPFGISEVVESYKLAYVSGIGIHVGITLSICYFIIPKLFPNIFSSEKWVIYKEILYILFTVFLVSCSNYLYSSTIGKDISPYRSFTQFLGITLAVGIFPIISMIFFMERNLNSKNSLKASNYNKELKSKKSKESTQEIRIKSENVKPEILSFNLDDFIFATSDNNYSTIHFLDDNTLTKQMMRLSFKNLESQLNDFSDVVRCHKSYIVNKSKIQKVSGNARSLVLKLENYENQIPVSRSFPKNQLI